VASRTDAELVTAAQGGDTGAVDELLRRHYDRVYAICRRVTGSDADALDATQEAMLGIVRGLASYDNRAKFSTWTYRVAVNASLDELRRRRRRPEPGLPDWHDPTDPAPSAADRLADREELEAALAALPDDFRAAVVLRDLGDLSYAEIAEALGIPDGTVRSRIARGRAALAAALGGNQAPPSERPTSGPR
jgi:RNA polymerase sigma-70 factor (ECF subfamily)